MPNSAPVSKVMELKSALSELILYSIFLIDVCILAFGMVDSNMYILNKAMKNLFLETSVSTSERLTFNTLTNVIEFWKFAEGPLLSGLFWKTWYNNNTLSPEESYIYYENLLLGVAQIRQVRVRDQTCHIHPYFVKRMKHCYHPYGTWYEETVTSIDANGSQWLYSPSGISEWHWGAIGTYYSGGYKCMLSRERNTSLAIIEKLKNSLWLNRGTRAVFIDFSVYNANLNLFCVIRLLVEFPASGGAVPSSKFNAVKLLRYVTIYDYFIAACEVAFCIFICTFIVQEILKIKKLKCDYFKSLFNCLEIVLIIMSLVSIGFNVYRTVTVNELLQGLLEAPDDYPDFHFLAFWQTHYNNMVAISVFFAWIKILKYITFNRTMSQLSSTLSRCAKDIMGFAFMFLIIFLAYAQLGYLVFGTQVEEFSSFPNCIFTQFRIILGDFNFAALQHTNRVLGPIYFITYVFFVFFVLLNMFLAIINDTYIDVKADFSLQKNEFELGDFIKKSYETALVKLRLRKAVVDNKQNRPHEPVFLEEDLDRQVTSANNADNTYKPPAYDLEDKKAALAQRQKWKERLYENYYSTQDANKDKDMVTQQEYQKLVKHSAELEKKLSEVTLKVNDMAKQKGKKPKSKQKETGDEIVEDAIEEILLEDDEWPLQVIRDLLEENYGIEVDDDRHKSDRLSKKNA